jgi:ubiquitin carboxyl-terminal hydrolase 12/46
MYIQHLPKVLIIHMKRFKFLDSLGRHVKLSYRVNFPLELVVAQRHPQSQSQSPPQPQQQAHNNKAYQLLSVVIHIGNSSTTGHYVTCVRSRDQWLLFDDESVRQIDVDTMLHYCFGRHHGSGSGNNSTGYILFYEQLPQQ